MEPSPSNDIYPTKKHKIPRLSGRSSQPPPLHHEKHQPRCTKHPFPTPLARVQFFQKQAVLSQPAAGCGWQNMDLRSLSEANTRCLQPPFPLPAILQQEKRAVSAVCTPYVSCYVARIFSVVHSHSTRATKPKGENEEIFSKQSGSLTHSFQSSPEEVERQPRPKNHPRPHFTILGRLQFDTYRYSTP